VARLRRLLWQPPRPHGQQPPERIVGPLELFYDLVVVVLIGQATRHLSGHIAWRGLGEYAAVFALVWIAWVNGSLHHELHSRDDARGRSMFLLQILVLVPLGAFIPEAGGGRGAAFALTAGVLFAVLALLWLLAARGDRPEDRRASRLFVTGSFLCAGICEGEQPGRRGRTLALTAQGRRLLQREAERACQRFGERLAGWSDRDITAFARMVERFLNDFG
jgi:hypothetical protein